MSTKDVYLVPYPQEIEVLTGRLSIVSSPAFVSPRTADAKEKLAVESIEELLGQLPDQEREAAKTEIRVGSISTLEDASRWLTEQEIGRLRDVGEQGYLLKVGREGVTIVGKTPIGTLYGAQTLVQLLRRRGKGYTVPHLRVLDYPSVEKRFLAPAMAWYAGYGRIGFGTQLWGWEQWKWFIHWCLQHKVNGLNLCIYGYYPFRFDEYPEAILKNLEVKTWVREVGREMIIRYTHPNITDEFLPRLIRYANERGIEVYCYFGLNTFNGGYAKAHPESRFYSTNPEKFGQFKYNLCPSREDVIAYLERSVRKLLEIGFNGIVFEESEGSGFCECEECQRRYYDADGDPRKALHKADHELLNRFYRVMKDAKPDAAFGVRMWRMGTELHIENLKKQKDLIPSDALIFWSNGIDYERFVGWVETFGPERIMGEDAECMGFAAIYGKLIYLVPEQYASYVEMVDPSFEPSYPQNLQNDIRQYQQAAKHGCRGVTGYAFEWYGFEIAPLSLAQYGWNPNKFKQDEFFEYGFKHLFGPELGPEIARSSLALPIVLETRVCEDVAPILPRDDPVSGGLPGLACLTIPMKFGGVAEMRALQADLLKAERSLEIIQKAISEFRGDPQYVTSLRYIENAARRTMRICKAGLEYRTALRLEKRSNPPRELIISHLESALGNLEEDYMIVKENFFDLTDEFYERTTKAMEIVNNRLNRWRSQGR
jgi:hypothetical protein